MTKQFKMTIGLVMLISSMVSAQIQITGNVEPSNLGFINVETQTGIYKGQAAIYGKQLKPENGHSLIKINDVELSTGIIEFDLAGAPEKGANQVIRGFLGLAFRVSEGNDNFDCFYLRTANGRAENQLQRNHTVQYVAAPDNEWAKLRKEDPGLYETYVDTQVGEWIHVKAIIEDNRAEIYVHNATEPTLVVNGLLGKNKSGGVALWMGPGTDAYFANLKITKLK